MKKIILSMIIIYLLLTKFGYLATDGNNIQQAMIVIGWVYLFFIAPSIAYLSYEMGLENE